MSAIKIDPKNPAVIILAVGALWFLMRGSKSTARVIRPTTAGSAASASNSGVSTLAAFGANLIRALGAKPSAPTGASTLFGYDTSTPLITISDSNWFASNDDQGAQFGGISPMYNSDNVLLWGANKLPSLQGLTGEYLD